MQLHQLKPTHKKVEGKRVGRGGKRGTFSGRGSKGQKSRAGTRIRPGFRGGDNPIWKVFPKQRGATKKVDIKHTAFQVHHEKPKAFNLDRLEKMFSDGDTVSPETLGVKSAKILGTGVLTKKLIFKDVTFSKTAHDKVH
ncbi:MAG: uL15 family ribosomal protein [Patescibacteria group bacterium]